MLNLFNLKEKNKIKKPIFMKNKKNTFKHFPSSMRE